MKGKLLSMTLLISLMSLFSCNKEELKPQSKDIEWVKIEVPEAGTIYSLNGNIENYLIVGGLGEISKTSDKGLTWSVVHDNFTAYELRNRQDTLYAIEFWSSTSEDYFSIDNGNTWKLSPTKSLEDLRTKTVTSSKGTIYKIVPSETFPIQPAQVVMSSDGGSTWIDIFPYKRYIYSIYIDKSDRLYIGASGWEWNESINSFDPDSGNGNGVIYFTK